MITEDVIESEYDLIKPLMFELYWVLFIYLFITMHIFCKRGGFCKCQNLKCWSTRHDWTLTLFLSVLTLFTFTLKISRKNKVKVNGLPSIGTILSYREKMAVLLHSIVTLCYHTYLKWQPPGTAFNPSTVYHRWSKLSKDMLVFPSQISVS